MRFGYGEVRLKTAPAANTRPWGQALRRRPRPKGQSRPRSPQRAAAGEVSWDAANVGTAESGSSAESGFSSSASSICSQRSHEGLAIAIKQAWPGALELFLDVERFALAHYALSSRSVSVAASWWRKKANPLAVLNLVWKARKDLRSCAIGQREAF